VTLKETPPSKEETNKQEDDIEIIGNEVVNLTEQESVQKKLAMIRMAKFREE
jgi:hypothetical protein